MILHMNKKSAKYIKIYSNYSHSTTLRLFLQIFTVCVQSAITSVNFTSQSPDVETNKALAFDYQIMDGTEVSARIDYGDGQIDNNNGATGELFFYLT